MSKDTKNLKCLVIVESPTKVKTIQKYLSSKYIVEASVGHVRQIESKAGSVTLKDGKFHFKWVTDEAKINKILLLAKKVDKIILATDMDREGEAISHHILTILNEHNIDTTNYERICFTEITEKAILEAIKNPRLLNNNLVNAYFARIGLDYLIGFTLSPILWTTLRAFGNKQSAGRVQSVALRLLAEKELERRKFSSHKYYSIEAKMINDNLSLKVDLKSCNIEYKLLNSLTEEESKNIYEHIINSNTKYNIDKINKDIRMLSPQAPFTTSTLQQESSTQLHKSIDETMKNAQKLYESGYITYHRSDSTYMGDDAITEVRNYISNTEKYKDYLSKSVNKYDKKSKNSQEAHECIRPTNINLSKLSDLDNNHQELYTLIRNRTIESQMCHAQQENTAYIFKNKDNIEFVYRDSHIILPSFYILYDHETKDDRIVLKKDMKFDIKDILKLEHQTKPPKRYTEASLIKQLESLGIGRPSTMANTLNTLFTREYAESKARSLEITFKGLCVNAFLSSFFGDYVDYNFTSDMELKLDEIVNGLDFVTILEKVINKLNKEVTNIKQIVSGNKDEAINDNNSIYNNINNRDDIVKKMGELLLINPCTKCGGTLILHQTYYFFSICEKCNDNNNLQIESHAISDSIQVINNGKYRYVQMAEVKVYLPDCIDHNITENDVKNIASLTKEVIYNDKKFVVGKTFKNFFICNEDKQYFNFNDTNTLNAILNLTEADDEKFKELKDFIYRNILQKRKYKKT